MGLKSRVVYTGRDVPAITYWRGRTPLYKTRLHDFGLFEETESYGHPWHPKSAKAGLDVGGPFTNTKVTVESPTEKHLWHVNTSGTLFYDYNGPVWPHLSTAAKLSTREENWTNSLGFMEDPKASSSELDALGTTAISRVIPTNPNADAAVALIELFREGLPSLVGSQILRRRRSLPQDAASEYLNWEFGVKPILSDLERVYEANQKAEEILLQLERDSGKLIRRRYKFPIEEDVSETVNTTSHKNLYLPDVPSAYLSRNGKLTTRRRAVTRSWFSGAFRYAVPSRVNMSAFQEARYLYGITVNPDVLWEVIPWSWLVDWVSNTGDVIHNLSAFAQDGLVLQYGYMMSHRLIEYEDIWEGEVKQGASWIPSRVSSSYSVETKQRRKATPFGFGLDALDFTSRQLAILTSIGITR